MKRSVKTFIGNTGQWLCVVLLTFSLIYEMHNHADIGYIGITVSAFLFAVFTKIKYLRGKK